jgi:hypothetical protein
MATMYGRLKSTRKRALAIRQLSILEKLLELDDETNLQDFYNAMQLNYQSLKSTGKAFVRDINFLSHMGAKNY